MACNLLFPHEDKMIPNKFRILKERHIRMRKPYQLPGWTKNSPYYSAPVGDLTRDLPHSIASSWPRCPTRPWSTGSIFTICLAELSSSWDAILKILAHGRSDEGVISAIVYNTKIQMFTLFCVADDIVSVTFVLMILDLVEAKQ